MWLVGICSRCNAVVAISPQATYSLSMLMKRKDKKYCPLCYVGEIVKLQYARVGELDDLQARLKTSVFGLREE